jgi:hypothetical protein
LFGSVSAQDHARNRVADCRGIMRQFHILLRPCACGAAEQSLDLKTGLKSMSSS